MKPEYFEWYELLRSHPHIPGRYPGNFTNSLWRNFFLCGGVEKFWVSSQDKINDQTMIPTTFGVLKWPWGILMFSGWIWTFSFSNHLLRQWPKWLRQSPMWSCWSPVLLLPLCCTNFFSEWRIHGTNGIFTYLNLAMRTFSSCSPLKKSFFTKPKKKRHMRQLWCWYWLVTV